MRREGESGRGGKKGGYRNDSAGEEVEDRRHGCVLDSSPDQQHVLFFVADGWMRCENVPATQNMSVKAEGRAGRERMKRRLAPQRGAAAMMREATASEGEVDAREGGELDHARD